MAGFLKGLACAVAILCGGQTGAWAQEHVSKSSPAANGLAEFRSGQFDNAGLTLHYSAMGKGQPVVILAGGPGFDPAYMKPVAAMIADHHSVILLEQRGTGRSRPAAIDATTVNENLVVQDIEALRVKLGVRRIGLVGHSFGTFTAMRYAIAHPDNVSWLVLLATVPPRAVDQTVDAYIGKRLPPESLARLGAIDAAMSKAGPADQDALSMEMATLILPAYLHDQTKAGAALAGMAGGGLHADTSQLIWSSVGKYDITSDLKSIHSPTMIIQGRDDVLDVGVAEKTRDGIPGATLVVLEDCGHFAWIEQPAALKASMMPFVSRR